MRRLTPALALVALLAPAAAPAQVPATIAVRTTQLPPAVAGDDRASAAFDSLVVATLAAAGYRVVAPDVATAAWTHARDSLGGYYDRATGAVVPARFRAVAGAALARLRAEHGADALLMPSVEQRVVAAERGTARWDGASQRVAGAGWMTVDVLSFRAVTIDTTGAALQCGAGGIRALVHHSLWNGKVRPVPPAQYFDEPGKNADAVRRALQSLVARAPACTPD